MSTHAYIGKIPDCGCVVACVVDDPLYRSETSKDVADFVKRGYIVERVSIESDQVLIGPCRHNQTLPLQDLGQVR